jgi:multidrug efflux system membrane fusion protein
MKKPRASRRDAFAIALLALGVASCAKKNEFVALPPPDVDVQAPEVRDVTTYREYPGTTSALETVEVRARVKGILEQINFKPGDFVKAEDILFVIEKAPFIAAQKVAQGRVAAAEADLKLAETELARKKEAVAKQAISKLDYETAVGKRDAAKAARDITEAELDNANLDLEYTDVLASIEGKTSKNFVDIGNLVGASETTLLTTVVKDSEVFANFEIDERSVVEYLRTRETRLKQGVSKVAETWTLKLRMADGRVYSEDGKANFFDNVLDPDAGSVQARAVFPNPKGHLLSGLFVRVMIPQVVEDAIMVPRQSIQRDLDGFFVLIVDGENVVEKRLVKPGPVVDQSLQIVNRRASATASDPGVTPPEGASDAVKKFAAATTSGDRTGLDGDERVVVRGFQRAREGSKVNPKTPAPTATPPETPAPATPPTPSA